jgi:hypothetical protein
MQTRQLFVRRTIAILMMCAAEGEGVQAILSALPADVGIGRGNLEDRPHAAEASSPPRPARLFEDGIQAAADLETG